jgi:hypothetical protein
MKPYILDANVVHIFSSLRPGCVLRMETAVKRGVLLRFGEGVVLKKRPYRFVWRSLGAGAHELTLKVETK